MGAGGSGSLGGKGGRKHLDLESYLLCRQTGAPQPRQNERRRVSSRFNTADVLNAPKGGAVRGGRRSQKGLVSKLT